MSNFIGIFCIFMSTLCLLLNLKLGKYIPDFTVFCGTFCHKLSSTVYNVAVHKFIFPEKIELQLRAFHSWFGVVHKIIYIHLYVCMIRLKFN